MSGDRGSQRARKTCPVCGAGYRGTLADHLNRGVIGAPGHSRCDWHLACVRIRRVPHAMRAAGWVQGGPVGGLLSRYLAATHPHLVTNTGGGIVPPVVTADVFDEAKDYKVWWVRPWMRSILLVREWPLRRRARLMVELDLDEPAQAVVMAASTVGGPDAVVALEGSVYMARCGAPVVSANVNADRCVLHAGHAGAHVGERAYGTPVAWVT